jgi:hypothetical protein
MAGLVTCFETRDGIPAVGPLDAPCRQVALRRLAVGAPELAAEVTGRHVHVGGERLQRRAWAGLLLKKGT